MLLLQQRLDEGDVNRRFRGRRHRSSVTSGDQIGGQRVGLIRKTTVSWLEPSTGSHLARG